MTTESATQARAPVAEARITLPARWLFVGVVVATLIMAGGWSLGVALGGWGDDALMSGLLGAGAVGAVALVGVLILTPWKARPIPEWMTMWLAATVFRLLVTPVAVYVLYSAASNGDSATGPTVPVKPLVLSVAATYFMALLTEAAIIASHVKRSLPPATSAVSGDRP
jgi:hypothetical protein